MIDPTSRNNPGRMGLPESEVVSPQGDPLYSIFAPERSPDAAGKPGPPIVRHGSYWEESLANDTTMNAGSVWQLEKLARATANSTSADFKKFNKDHHFVDSALIYVGMGNPIDSIKISDPAATFKNGWNVLAQKSDVTNKTVTVTVLGLDGTKYTIDLGTPVSFVAWLINLFKLGINVFIELQPPVVPPTAADSNSDIAKCFYESNRPQMTYHKILDPDNPDAAQPYDPWLDGFGSAIGFALRQFADVLKAKKADNTIDPGFPEPYPAKPMVCIKFGSEMNLVEHEYAVSLTRYTKGTTTFAQDEIDPNGVLHPLMTEKALAYKVAYGHIIKRLRQVVSSYTLVLPGLTADDVTAAPSYINSQLKFAWVPEAFSGWVHADSLTYPVNATKSVGGQYLNKAAVNALCWDTPELEFVGFDAYGQFERGLTHMRYAWGVDENGMAKVADLRTQWIDPATNQILPLFTGKVNLDEMAKADADLDTSKLTEADFKPFPAEPKLPRKKWGINRARAERHSEVGGSSSAWKLPEHVYGLPMYGLVTAFGRTKRYLVGETNCYVVPKCMHDDFLGMMAFAPKYITSSSEAEKRANWLNRDVLQSLFSYPPMLPKPSGAEVLGDSGGRLYDVKSDDAMSAFISTWFSKVFWVRRADEYLRLWALHADLSMTATWFIQPPLDWQLSAKAAAAAASSEVLDGQVVQSLLKAYEQKGDKGADGLVFFRKSKGRSYAFDDTYTDIDGANGQKLAGAKPVDSNQALSQALADILVAGDADAEKAKAAMSNAQWQQQPITGFVTKAGQAPTPQHDYKWSTPQDFAAALAHFQINKPAHRKLLKKAEFAYPVTEASSGNKGAVLDDGFGDLYKP